MSGADGSDEITITRAQARFVSWVSEVLLDIVVLNLFVEYVRTIVIDSFAISVLTALLMKLAIDAVKGLDTASPATPVPSRGWSGEPSG